jgi:hypothetical protein
VLDWWQAEAQLPIAQRLSRFCSDVVLGEIPGPVVVFVDEIDSTLSLDFSDDFFAAIRALYHARAGDEAVRRLTFVLIGVATPGDLIRDPKRTPFNIGARVDLEDFSEAEAAPLAVGLGLPPDDAQRVLADVLRWTGGHPAPLPGAGPARGRQLGRCGGRCLRARDLPRRAERARPQPAVCARHTRRAQPRPGRRAADLPGHPARPTARG